MNNRWIRFSGMAGLVIIFFGLTMWFVTGEFVKALTLIHILIGALLLIVWFIQHGAHNMSHAGEVMLGRTARFGSLAVFYTALFVTIVVCVNWLAARHNKRWDLTKEGVYSLAGQSAAVIKGLKKPLTIVAFDEDPENGAVNLKELLELYRYNNTAMVTTRIVDPRKELPLVEAYEMKPGNIIYMEYGEGDNKGVSRLNDANEEAITNAIVKLTRGDAKKIYYVEGHGEPDLMGTSPQGLKDLYDAIGDEHLTIEGIVLAQKAAVPDDATAVILASPKKPLLPGEGEMLMKYADGGGHLLLLTDPRTTSDVKDIAAHFGIEVGNNVVIDQVMRLFAGPELGVQPMVRAYTPHPITKGFGQQHLTIFNIASTVKATGKSENGVSYTDLLKTGPTAWGETNIGLIFDSQNPTAQLDKDGDVIGPVSLATVYEKKIGEDKKEPPKEGEEQKPASNEPEFKQASRVVVFGDSDWIANANLQVSAHRDLILNSINWLVGEEGGLSIRARSIKASLAPMPAPTFKLLLATIFIVPEAILLFGLVVWWRRRAVIA